MHFFFAEVVDVENDDEKAGRAKIRLVEDQSKLKDEELRYARPIFPVTHASKGKAGTSARLIKGSKVFGFFIDDDKQIPYILGSFPSSGTFGSLSDSGRDIVAGVSKDPGKFGIKTQDLKLLKEGELDTKSGPEKAEKEDNGEARKAKVPTIGTKIPEGLNPVDQIKKIDPQNLGGFMGPNAFSLLKSFQLGPAGKLLNMVGGAAVLAGIASQILNNQKNNNVFYQKQTDNDLLNIVMTIINYIKSINPTTYRTNIGNIQTQVNQLKTYNTTSYASNVNNVITISDSLTTTTDDKLTATINILIDNLNALKTAIAEKLKT